jgi:hypothetical protein
MLLNYHAVIYYCDCATQIWFSISHLQVESAQKADIQSTGQEISHLEKRSYCL